MEANKGSLVLKNGDSIARDDLELQSDRDRPAVCFADGLELRKATTCSVSAHLSFIPAFKGILACLGSGLFDDGW